jgi:chorismate mutase
VNKEHLPTIPMADWLPNAKKPVVIAGPCSAESEAQIMQVAAYFAKSEKVQLIRAGVWKPRTRPNSFEGMGVEALPWLAKAQKEFGVRFVIEVAKAEHVKAALAAGMEYLWIGARTTVNPFSVQEIADELEGKDIPVFVKNPINPDLQLWIGAMERLLKAGINKIAAVHRGFNAYNDPVYRNSPQWEIPIELKTKFPNLDIIVDPSHICGKRDLLLQVSQKALDLGFDGLMIETHPNPDEALSDPKQQIWLHEFNGFIDQLEIKQKHFHDKVTLDHLAQLRKMIDEIDHHLIENLKKRQDIVERIGTYKAEQGVTVFQVERWAEIMQDRNSYGALHQLDSELIKGIWQEIHQSSIQLQTIIANRNIAEKK